MLILLSPAKTLDFTTPVPKRLGAAKAEFSPTLPEFIPDSSELIEQLRQLSVPQVAQLMDLSDNLASLNVARFATWQEQFSLDNAKQALFCFAGDVYDGLDAYSLTPKHLSYLQNHLRMLSGLYGVLRPLDLMQAYRLEMSTRFANSRGKDLYAFWGQRLTMHLNALLAQTATETSAKNPPQVVLNLASEEYFKVVQPKLLTAPVITPVFEDYKNGRYKIISFFAKRARGMMARYCALHQITQVKKLKKFNLGGYAFDAGASDAQHWVFRRDVALALPLAANQANRAENQGEEGAIDLKRAA